MTKKNFLIYGSYGYTGNLIAEDALKEGLKPVLGGRNKDKLSAQAKRLGLDYQVFDIANLDEAKEVIKHFVAVIHCAGPFIKTYQHMVKACLQTNTHYMDITGEVSVIENLSQLHEDALEARIMLLPGAGFDVVPSDCLAHYLKDNLPDATQLILAIHAFQGSSKSKVGVSRGTAKTVIENLAEDSVIRENGSLKRVPLGFKKRTFNFGDDKLIDCVAVTWGDLASAWWSTHIPNIETYMSISPKINLMFKLLNPIKTLFKWAPIKQLLINRINKMPEGPSEEELKTSSAKIYGEVINGHGVKKAALLHTPNGYALTSLAAIHIVKKILSGVAPIGFQTPSTAYSSNLILEIPGVKRTDITP